MKLQEMSTGAGLVSRIGEERVRAWIRERESLLFRTLPGMEPERWVSYHAAELERLGTMPGAVVFEAPEVPCVLVGRPLEWDTGILGIPMASLDYLLFPGDAPPESVREALSAACGAFRERGWRLLIHKSSPADLAAVNILGRCAFDLLTVHLEYVFPADVMHEHAAPREGYVFEEANAGDEEALGELSAANHATTDRFFIDALLPRDRIPEVYREWARNSVRGHADLVWVARRDGRPVGFGTWGIRERLMEHTGIRCAEYQLGAVDAGERNRGLFRRITAGALARLAERGEKWGSGATNALNTATQRCFQSLGAWIHASIFTFRKDLHRD